VQPQQVEGLAHRQPHQREAGEGEGQREGDDRAREDASRRT